MDKPENEVEDQKSENVDRSHDSPPFSGRETLPAEEEKNEKQRNEAEPKPRTFQTPFHKEPGSFSIAKNEGFSSEIDSSKAQFR